LRPSPTAPNLLLTGRPGVGKTTVLLHVLERLPVEAAGFYTLERRRRGQREGFDLVTIGGQPVPMATRGAPGPSVGSYGVDIGLIDSVGVPEILRGLDEADLLVIDEIGKMECLSEAFRDAALRALDSPVPVLGVIQLVKGDFADKIKARDDVSLFHVEIPNRDHLPDVLVQKLSRLFPWAASGGGG